MSLVLSPLRTRRLDGDAIDVPKSRRRSHEEKGYKKRRRGAGKPVDPPSDEGADDYRRHELAQDAEGEAHRVPDRPVGGARAVLPQAACARRLTRIALLG